MLTDGILEPGAGPTHRYFPDWADLPWREGPLPESDRNSYSAGGYAEEFGYSAQSGLPALAPTLDGDPESGARWHLLVGCLHPGYPERPQPLAQDWMLPEPGLSGRARTYSTAAPAGGSRDFKVIRVDECGWRRPHGPPRLWRAILIRLRAL
jgi:hypothetical protein